MLAEIYLLRLETLMRASEEGTLAENFRFVPPNPVSFRDVRMKGDGKMAATRAYDDRCRHPQAERRAPADGVNHRA